MVDDLHIRYNMTDYEKYRGKCREYCDAAIAENPSLRLVRGYYWCPISNREEQHWWTVDLAGEIYDPTSKQFLSAGLGTYREFDGTVECDECGKVVAEEDASFDGRYAFCSYECYGHFIGML
jgi:hypothetical protein